MTVTLWTLWSGVLLVAAAQSWAALTRPHHDRLADLHVYVSSVRMLHDGGSLYDFAAHNGAPFTYPPFAGLVFSPLAVVAEAPLQWAWTAGTLLVLGYVAWLVTSADGIHRLVPRRFAFPVVALVLALSAPVSSGIRFGQVSLLLVALVLVDFLVPGQHKYRGIATGVAGAIKLTPLIFVPYFWAAGQRRTCLTALGAFGVCTAIACVVLPGESVRFWLTEIWRVERVGNIDTIGNQSFNGALLRLGLPDPVRGSLVIVCGLVVVAAAIARAVYAYRNRQPLVAAVVMGAAGLVVSPVSWTHHQVWLVIAGLLAVSTRTSWNLAWAAVTTAVMILPVISWGGDLLGGVVTGNIRLLLAIAVACLVPFNGCRTQPTPAGQAPAPQPKESPVHAAG